MTQRRSDEPQIAAAGPPRTTRAILVGLVLFPFLLAVAGRAILSTGADEQARVDLLARLETTLSTIEAGKSHQEHFSRFFQRLERQVFAASAPVAVWSRIMPALKARYPGQIQGVLLDGEGNPLPDWTDRPTARALTRKFVAAYRRFLDTQEPMPSLVEGFLKTYFGPFTVPGVRIHRRLFFAAGQPNRRFVYLSAPHPQGMFFLFFNPRDDIRVLALEEAAAALRRRGEPGRLAVARRGERGARVWRRLGLSPHDFARHWQALHQATEGHIWIGSTLLARRLLFPDLWIVGRADLPTSAAPYELVRPLLWGLAALLLVLGRPGPLGTLLDWLGGSVRGKLMAAFLYSAAVPLLVMGLTAQTYLHNRRAVLEAESHQAMEETLQGFDRRFRVHIAELEGDLRQFVFSRERAPADGFRDFLDRFAEMRTRFGFNTCRIYDRTGEPVYVWNDPAAPGIGPATVRALGRMVRQFFVQLERERLAGTASEARPVVVKGADEFAETSINIQMLFFNEMESGPFRYFLFTAPLGTAEHRITHFVTLVWDSRHMEVNYLRRHLPRLARRAGRGEYFVWSPLEPDLAFPPDFPHRRLVATTLRRVSSATRSHRATLTGPRGTWLVTGLRGTALRGFSLLGMVSDQPLVAEISSLRWNLGFIALVIVGACIIIGVLLAGFFLVPVRTLAAGMTALADRRFDTRLPVVSNDELGGLASLLNDALGDLQDLEVARAVQELLFPGQPLTAGAWGIAGRCRTASQVGGDFHDYSRQGDGTLRVVLGDVAGHGVGAALVVGLVKAALGHPGCPTAPDGALSCLNSLLGSILQRKKMMGCNLAAFDPETAILTLANAGQTFPILVRGGRASFLELKGYPLGSTRRWQAACRQEKLHEHDAVIFYTDGLVEALDADGQPIGFDRLLAVLPALCRPTAEATVEAIEAWHHAMSPQEPPADDITVVVLQWQGLAATALPASCQLPAADSDQPGLPGPAEQP